MGGQPGHGDVSSLLEKVTNECETLLASVITCHRVEIADIYDKTRFSRVEGVNIR